MFSSWSGMACTYLLCFFLIVYYDFYGQSESSSYVVLVIQELYVEKENHIHQRYERIWLIVHAAKERNRLIFISDKH